MENVPIINMNKLKHPILRALDEAVKLFKSSSMGYQRDVADLTQAHHFFAQDSEAKQRLERKLKTSGVTTTASSPKTSATGKSL